MKRIIKAACGVLAITTAIGFVGCNKGKSSGAVKLTVWVSEADRAFANSVIEEFKAKNPDKEYQFTVDIQGENDVATRILNDVESAADVFSYINDQTSKLINGDCSRGSRANGWNGSSAPIPRIRSIPRRLRSTGKTESTECRIRTIPFSCITTNRC